MTYRFLALVCGMILGVALRTACVIDFPAHSAPGVTLASQSQSGAHDPRCAEHPVKMPCLFDHSH